MPVTGLGDREQKELFTPPTTPIEVAEMADNRLQESALLLVDSTTIPHWDEMDARASTDNAPLAAGSKAKMQLLPLPRSATALACSVTVFTPNAFAKKVGVIFETMAST